MKNTSALIENARFIVRAAASRAAALFIYLGRRITKPENMTNKDRLKDITDSIEAGIQGLFQSEK